MTKPSLPSTSRHFCVTSASIFDLPAPYTSCTGILEATSLKASRTVLRT